MKWKVFVLIPYEVPPVEFDEFVRLLLERHRINRDDDVPFDQTVDLPGRFESLVGPLDQSFDDKVAGGRLPLRIRRVYSGNICDRANLPHDAIPATLVTPDGEWHDLVDFGWKLMDEPAVRDAAAAKWEIRYRELIAAFSQGWVIAVWARS